MKLFYLLGPKIELFAELIQEAETYQNCVTNNEDQHIDPDCVINLELMKLYIYRGLGQDNHIIYTSVTETIEKLQSRICEELSIPSYEAQFTYQNSDGSIFEIIHNKQTIKSSGLTELSTICIEQIHEISGFCNKVVV